MEPSISKAENRASLNRAKIEVDRAMTDPLPLYVRGVIRGYYSPGERTYYRRATRANFAHKYGGWGIQAEAVDMLKAEGCEKVVIHLDDEARSVEAPMSAFFEFGTRASLTVEDGLHVFLHQSHFKERLQKGEPMAVRAPAGRWGRR